MYLLSTSCWICGEENHGLTFGHGFLNHVSLIPAIENSTGKLTSVSQGHEDQFRYYTDPSMYEANEESVFLEWGDLRLCTENNYCPECEEMSMDFLVVGEGD